MCDVSSSSSKPRDIPHPDRPGHVTPGARRIVERTLPATGIPTLAMESPRGERPVAPHAATYLERADFVLLLGKRLDFAVRFGAPPASRPPVGSNRRTGMPRRSTGSGRVTLEW